MANYYTKLTFILLDEGKFELARSCLDSLITVLMLEKGNVADYDCLFSLAQLHVTNTA